MGDQWLLWREGRAFPKEWVFTQHRIVQILLAPSKHCLSGVLEVGTYLCLGKMWRLEEVRRWGEIWSVEKLGFPLTHFFFSPREILTHSHWIKLTFPSQLTH